MKKILIIELVLFLLLFLTSRIDNSLPFVLNLLCVIGFPVYKLFSGMKRDVNKFAPKEEPKQEAKTELKTEPKQEPAKSEPKKQEKKKPYNLWLDLTDELQAEDFFICYKRDMNTIDDYSLTVKELKEDYDGETVYKYYPYSLPFKIEGNEVYSYMKKDDWILIGKVRDKDMQLLERSKYQQLFLYANIYKEVTEESVEKVEDEPFFNLKIRMPG